MTPAAVVASPTARRAAGPRPRLCLGLQLDSAAGSCRFKPARSCRVAPGANESSDEDEEGGGEESASFDPDADPRSPRPAPREPARSPAEAAAAGAAYAALRLPPRPRAAPEPPHSCPSAPTPAAASDPSPPAPGPGPAPARDRAPSFDAEAVGEPADPEPSPSLPALQLAGRLHKLSAGCWRPYHAAASADALTLHFRPGGAPVALFDLGEVQEVRAVQLEPDAAGPGAHALLLRLPWTACLLAAPSAPERDRWLASLSALVRARQTAARARALASSAPIE
eukprot:tig00000571_g2182.t1